MKEREEKCPSISEGSRSFTVYFLSLFSSLADRQNRIWRTEVFLCANGEIKRAGRRNKINRELQERQKGKRKRTKKDRERVGESGRERERERESELRVRDREKRKKKERVV